MLILTNIKVNQLRYMTHSSVINIHTDSNAPCVPAAENKPCS